MPLTAVQAWEEVSTHSRPKAAGGGFSAFPVFIAVSTHSRPKAAGQAGELALRILLVSTHSRPKAAGCAHAEENWAGVFQHTAARRRLAKDGAIAGPRVLVFQHTAARRRLAIPTPTRPR